MKRRPVSAAVLAFGLLVAEATLAFDIRLSPEAIREAYFLGQRHDQTGAEFLSKYVKHLPMPKSGPYISEIEVQTPYAQVVGRSWRVGTAGYSAQQAEQEYRERGDLIIVRVLIRLTRSYPLLSGQHGTVLRSGDFWKGFLIELTQKGETIRPLDTRGEPYWLLGRNSSVLDGAQVWVEFDAANVESGPAKVEVATPDGQRVTAEFDLAKLR